jgi:hypothetical protein
MKVYEIKSPIPTKNIENNVKRNLEKARKENRTEVVTLYMGKETAGVVHREHIQKGIDTKVK